MYLDRFSSICNRATRSPADRSGGASPREPIRSSRRHACAKNGDPKALDLGLFAPLVARGHTADLFYIIPAGAPLAPESHLTADKVREGKIPGLPTADGWLGLRDRNSYYCTPAQLAKWTALARRIGGAPPPIGFNARVVHGFDCDTDDAEIAAAVHRRMAKHFTLGIRGRPGSCHWLAPFKLATPIRHLAMQVWPEGKDRAKRRERLALIEVIAVGQQWLESGHHSKSGTDYEWTPTANGKVFRDVDRAQIATIDNAAFTADWKALADDLRAMGHAVTVGGEPCSWNASKGRTADPAPCDEAARDALSYVPDLYEPENPIDYNELVKWVHAISAACNGSPEGEQIAVDWTSSYDDGTDVEAEVRRIYKSIDPAKCRVGWNWLRKQAIAMAERYSGKDHATKAASKLLGYTFAPVNLDGAGGRPASKGGKGADGKTARGRRKTRSGKGTGAGGNGRGGDPPSSLALPPGSSDPPVSTPLHSEDDLAQRLVRKHSDELRYVAKFGRWLRWSGMRWQEDETLAAYDLVRRLCRTVSTEVKGRRAREMVSAKWVAAVEKHARSDREVAMTADGWDGDPWLLNQAEGTADLRETEETERSDEQ